MRPPLTGGIAACAVWATTLLASFVLVGLIGSFLHLADVPPPVPGIILLCTTLGLAIGQAPLVEWAAGRTGTVLPRSRPFALGLLLSSGLLVAAAVLIADTL